MIESYYAWVADGPDGEYTVGAILPGMGHVPLGSPKRLVAENMRPLAESHRIASGHKVRFVEFSHRRDIHVIE